MGILDRFKKEQAPIVHKGMRVYATQVLGKTPATVYNEQPELRAVVSFIQDAISSTPLKLYTRKSDNDRVRDRDSVAAKLLATPNGHSTTHELIRATVGDICLYGAAIWFIDENEALPSGFEITHIPYSWVQDELTTDGFTVSTYVVKNPESGRAAMELNAANVLTFSHYNPANPVHPVSPVESLKGILAERLSAVDYRNKIWRNGGWFSRWISRPAGVTWTAEQQERWAKSWKQHFAGKNALDTGGTPILEDGMQLHDTAINAREAQFVESAKLTREDVCSVYHINQSLIYHTDAQTYASAKDNARALYSEGLMPYMVMICQKINAFLLPYVGMEENSYVEFDLTSKTQASFEELASVLTSAAGTPWLTADEARARLNLPAKGGDAAYLVQPLNIAYGGGGVSNVIDGTTNDPKAATPKAKTEAELKLLAKTWQKASPEAAVVFTKVLRKFFERQSKKVIPAIQSQYAKAAAAGTKESLWSDNFDPDAPIKPIDEAWWDAKRWNRELAKDLNANFGKYFDEAAKNTLSDLKLDADLYHSEYTEQYVQKVAESSAKAINDATYKHLRKVLDSTTEESDLLQGIKDVFEMAQDSRAERTGLSVASDIATRGQREAIKQARLDRDKGKRVFKTWRHAGNSDHPRLDHLAMDGETVAIDDTFSNGATWPHDWTNGSEDSCYCQCEVEFTIYG